MKHWAWDLIGKPYRSGCSGPEMFDCVGLARYYFKERHQILLPDYSVAEGTPRELAAFVRATGWKRAAGKARSEDLLTMENFLGRHVGIAVQTTEGLGLLHATGDDNRGSVVWQPLNTLAGYRNIEIWRNPCLS